RDMATIRIAETVHPLRPTRSATDAITSGIDDGIYNMRSISRSSTRERSRDRWTGRVGTGDKEAEDDDPGLRQTADFKHKQVFSGKLLLWLSYQSIGVIYGDIGTSPLYVYSSTFKAAPSYEDLIGALSIILWSLTMMVTVKYILVILYADNDGEGGTFSTYSLLSRYVNITNRDPREASLVEMRRHLSGDLERAGRQMRQGLEKSKWAKALLKTIGVLAVSMVMSDGVLTPAQSVLGAVQGLEVVAPGIKNGTVVGVTAAILILLFLIQPLGTTKIATTFAPIVITWLAFNACFGIYNLAKFDDSVLKAFNPAYGFEYLIRHKTEGWKSLGGVLLAFTGVEALFADLGAFSRKAIQISWLCYTFPCLLLAYIGQAAYISVHPEAYSNPFFKSVPPGTLYPSLIIAILAAIVASQAIITATFQLLAQIMKLSYFPQIKVVHTSKTFHGQLYVPLVNWLLMIGTVLVAVIYNNTTSLGNAYGVCVMFVTFFDTCMVSLAAMFVWRISPYWIFLPWLTIACLDGTYLSSALVKVPDGAWFTITLSAILASLFILWRFGKEQQWASEAAERFPTTHFVKKQDDGSVKLVPRYGGGTLSTIKGLGIFFDKAGETTPIVFSQFAIKLVAAPEVMVFFHLRPLETPSVPAEARYSVSRLAIPNCYRLIVRHGYMDEVITPDLAPLIHQQVRNFIILRQAAPQPLHLADAGVDDKSNDASEQTASGADVADEKVDSAETRFKENKIAAELAKLDEAFNLQVLYIIGKEQMKIKAGNGWFRKILLYVFLWLRDNTRTKIANLSVPTDRVIEVGFVKDI
ncbi:Potassium transporter 5, partial [Hyphodiscus hymeniophilus]